MWDFLKAMKMMFSLIASLIGLFACEGHIRNAVIDIKGVGASSFASKTNGCAVGARRTYYKGNPISEMPGVAEYLSMDNAKSTSGVFYDGKKIRGANAATFTMTQSAPDLVDATDRQGKYLNGKRV